MKPKRKYTKRTFRVTSWEEVRNMFESPLMEDPPPPTKPESIITTREGRRVKIYQIYDETIHGAMLVGNCWIMMEWFVTGRYCVTNYSKNDLVFKK